MSSPSDRHSRPENTGDGSAEEAELLTNWIRWPDLLSRNFEGEFIEIPRTVGDIHLHRMCSINPFETTTVKKQPVVTFVGGVVRETLRLTPIIMLTLTLVMIGYGELSPNINGVSEFIPALSTGALLIFFAVTGIWLLSLLILRSAGFMRGTLLFRSLLTYVFLLALSAGTILSIYLVFSAENPATLSDNIIYLSGYFLLLLLGGSLIYDGMLRTETLFGTPDEPEYSGRADIIYDQDRYSQFQSSLHNGLNRTVDVDVLRFSISAPVSHVFATVFVSQFILLWVLGEGPQNLDSRVTLVVNAAANLIITIIAFRFLILVGYFYKFLWGSYRGSDGEKGDIIRYQPFHVDRFGGFRDYGRFATRVSIILILGGLYLVYRLYVQGLRILPPGGFGEFQFVGATLWLINYLGPVLVYLLVVFVWTYYSFWSIHRKMALDKEQICKRVQGKHHDAERVPRAGDHIDAFASGPDWLYLQNAPEWPLKIRVIVTLLSANIVPVLATIFSLLQSSVLS